MIWLAIAIMTVMAAVALLTPLRRSSARPAGDLPHEKLLFRDQLAELERDRRRGAIGEGEAEAARNEISRRIIAAAKPPPGPTARSRTIAIFGALLVPIIAVAVYLQFGSPRLADAPLAARLEQAIDKQDFAALIVRVERHLEQHPDDAEGWRVLAPAYRRERRWQDAAQAYANLARLSKDDGAAMADHGEMVVFANDGVVTQDAARAFSAALDRDGALSKARFYLALALKQEGRKDEARRGFETLLADAPGEASWRPMAEAELLDLADPETQQVMIHAMVDGLEARLKTHAGDAAGWRRLIRSRMVLKEPDKAKAALAGARIQFRNRPDVMAELDELARELGLE